MADHDGKDGMSIPQLLMIEDDARLATMVGEYLKQSGYGVAHAGDGETGLAMLQDAPVDLVVLDLMLPGIDGLEVCRRIRAQPGEAARVPVLMLTAKVQKKRRNARSDQHAAPHQPGVPHARRGHAQTRGRDGAAQAFEPAQAALAGFEDAVLHRQVAVQIAEPADAL